MIAPLFKVVAPTDTRLRLERDAELQGNEILCLGTDPEGVPGTLPPGGEGAVTVVFQSTHCLSCAIEFVVHLFTPPREAAVDWQSQPVPAGMSAGDWALAVDALPDALGRTWPETHASLARLATRLSRHGIPGASVRDLFRFAVREALGRPASAVLGCVSSASDGTPLAAAGVLALDDGIVVSSAMTDANGFYTLDFLEGETYEVALAAYRIVSTRAGGTSVAVPERGDVLFYDIHAEPEPNGLMPACPNCGEAGLPTAAFVPPPGHFTPVAAFPMSIVSSIDPNDKEGPGELEGPIPPEERLHYRIRFENDADATAAAHTVEVIDWLDPALFDVASLEFGALSVGEDSAQSLPFSLESSFSLAVLDDASTAGIYSSEVIVPVTQFRAGQDPLHLDVSARIDLELDPACQEECEPACDPACLAATPLVRLKWTIDTLTSDPLAGFLLPNDARNQGRGQVSFSVRPVAGLQHGAVIENDAAIIFDGLETVPTGVWTNSIDRTLPPQAPRFPRPGDGATDVPLDAALEWEAPTRGETFEVYLWADPGPRPEEWVAAGVTHVRLSGLGFVAEGTSYRWQVIARNAFGAAPGPEWRFATARPPSRPFHRGDANDDGAADISDAVFTLLYLFRSGAEPSCLESANANDDRVVDISDGIHSLTHLFLRGAPAPAPGLPPLPCGPDPDTGQPHLGCEAYESCEEAALGSRAR